ncbi:MAG: hypothetical protein ACRC5T_04380 [Cetobacterium sp.]
MTGIREFTASNGVEVLTAGAGVRVGATYVKPVDVVALRDFFATERDVALGIWRSEVSPNFVVYDNRTDPAGSTIYTFNEEDFTKRIWSGPPPVEGNLSLSREWQEHAAVSREFYVRTDWRTEPWHFAEQGEIWAVDHAGDGEYAYRVVLKFERPTFEFVDGETNFPTNDPLITDARRIWPE